MIGKREIPYFRDLDAGNVQLWERKIVHISRLTLSLNFKTELTREQKIRNDSLEYYDAKSTPKQLIVFHHTTKPKTLLYFSHKNYIRSTNTVESLLLREVGGMMTRSSN